MADCRLNRGRMDSGGGHDRIWSPAYRFGPTTYTGDGYHAWMGVMHCVRGLCYCWVIACLIALLCFAGFVFFLFQTRIHVLFRPID